MPDYKTINVDPETYENIQKLAAPEGRTLGGQVKVLVNWELRRIRVREISELPHPEDAQPVPLVIAQEVPENPMVSPED